jgi:hypothetical protein
VEPPEAIRAAEDAMRHIIRLVLGETWSNALNSSERYRLRRKLEAEERTREGVIVPVDLLAYTDTSHLTKIILSEWPAFLAVFKNETRTRVAFEALTSYRNASQHNRPLVPFERDLLSGISGQIRNFVTLYLNDISETRQHYPVIEFAMDSLGNPGLSGDDWISATSMAELEVGSVLTFDARGWDPRDRQLEWMLFVNKSYGITPYDEPLISTAVGNDVSLSVTITDEMVALELYVSIVLANESRYHARQGIAMVPHDDRREWLYRVNPPL